MGGVEKPSNGSATRLLFSIGFDLKEKVKITCLQLQKNLAFLTTKPLQYYLYAEMINNVCVSVTEEVKNMDLNIEGCWTES